MANNVFLEIYIRYAKGKWYLDYVMSNLGIDQLNGKWGWDKDGM